MPSKKENCVRAIDLADVRLLLSDVYPVHCLCSQAFVKAGNIQMYFILGLVVANRFPTIILKERRHHNLLYNYVNP